MQLYAFIISLYSSYLILNLKNSSLVFVSDFKFIPELVGQSNLKKNSSSVYEYVVDLLKKLLCDLKNVMGNSSLLVNVMMLYLWVLCHKNKFVVDNTSIRKRWFGNIDECIKIIDEVNLLSSSSVGVNMDSEDDVLINDVINRIKEDDDLDINTEKTEKEEDRVANFRKLRRSERWNKLTQLIEKENFDNSNEAVENEKEKAKKEDGKDGKKKRAASEEKKQKGKGKKSDDNKN
jgi:hypothetical protein